MGIRISGSGRRICSLRHGRDTPGHDEKRTVCLPRQVVLMRMWLRPAQGRFTAAAHGQRSGRLVSARLPVLRLVLAQRQRQVLLAVRTLNKHQHEFPIRLARGVNTLLHIGG